MKIQWGDFEIYTNDLIEKIKLDKYNPEIIIAIGISGLIPSAIVAKGLNVKNIQIITIESYGYDNKKMQPKIISDGLSDSLLNKRILVVDDIIATGETFRLVEQKLNLFKPSEVRFASCIVSEYVCKNYPDYWGKSIMREPDDFIILPWDNEINPLQQK